MMLFNYIHRFYNYIKNVLCIAFYSNKKNYCISSYKLHYANQYDEYYFNDGNRDEENDEDGKYEDGKYEDGKYEDGKYEDDDYEEDNGYKFDEEASLNIPDNKQRLYITSKLHVSKIKRFTKSSSYASKNYYCGFCYKRIETPIFMYSDKVFCTSICRNNQLHQDNQQLNVDTRMNHSRSM